uniref:G protein gamma domain-containing protein n=1 Tax=Arion vulgaris TaxID=1028688 RepID=A0A0B7BHG5_9EUPU
MPNYTNAREAEAIRRTKMELQSLQSQASMRRHKTSETIGELTFYISSNINKDLLIYPDKVNPFKQKKMCTIM